MMRLRSDSGGRPFKRAPQIILNGVTPAPTTKENYPASDLIEIMFGGRLNQQKGVDLIPEILRRAKLPRGKRARLRIFGDGELRPILSDLSQSSLQGWTIELNPPVTDFRQRLATADVLIMPSRFEGLPLTAVEACLAGTPIVATRSPGTIESLPENHPWLAMPDDAGDFAAVLSQALADSESWSKVAADCQEFAQNRFSIDKMSAAYAEVYSEIALDSVNS